MTLIALAVAAQAVTWNSPSGLTLEQLAAKYVDNFGHASVVVAKPGFKGLVARFHENTLAELGVELRNRFKFAPGKFGGFADKSWPDYVVFRQDTINHRRPDGELSTLAGFRWDGGMLSGQTEIGKPVEVEMLKQLGWSRPLKCHWFLRSIPVYVVASRASEADVLSSVAEAVGGELRVTSQAYEIKLDTHAFRERLIATYTEQAENQRVDRVERAKYRAAAMVLRRAKDEEISDLYSSEGKERIFSKLDDTVSEQLDIALKEYFAQTEGSTNASLNSAVNFYRDRIDFGRPRSLILRSVGGALVRAIGKNPTEAFDL